ncbi:endonuclease/exonuclease/phosphatase family protein [Amycolatopsis mediterranei]|uniref:endonuclease/exonuclease/phosphatase family protein n=1 Tax=Amycolatopsis mediterranei TaxID=33910 RepID=UPI00344995EB
MTIYLTWNVYHGTLPTGTPVQRIERIVRLGVNHSVDVICLQECPQNLLDPAVPVGQPGPTTPFVTALNAAIPGWSTYYNVLQVYSEENPNTPKWVNSTDGYLVFFRTNVFSGYANLGYYNAGSFRDPIGNYLRPPVRVDLRLAAGGGVTVFDWHADTGGPQVACAVAALNSLLGPAQNQAAPTAVCGDFNYAGPLNNLLLGTGRQPFPGWDDSSVYLTNPAGQAIANGVDHILTSEDSMFVLNNQLDFKSDAYHYPFAVDM